VWEGEGCEAFPYPDLSTFKGSSRDRSMVTKSRHLVWLFALGLLLFPSIALAWSGKVVGVIDGDSITVLHDGGQEQIRLWGIDCPEKGQDFGTKAKQLTATLVFSKVVEIEPVTKDRYGRTVAFVRVGDRLLNEELVRQGLPRVFTRYCNRPICQEWQILKAEARERKRGLWCMPNAIPPWKFRKSRR
jgi:micrococcal nuclease